MLRCPQCHSTLRRAPEERRVYCDNQFGVCTVGEGFPIVRGLPVLVLFEKSVLCEESFRQGDVASPIHRRKDGGPWKGLQCAARKCFEALRGTNPVVGRNCGRWLREIRRISPNPIVLNIGGTSIGQGARAVYDDVENVRVLCFDIYALPETDFIADAHDIPLADASVDGVWIQAVLEHVLQPDRVVAEIHRVLKPGGVVYAEIPFMQTVHEGAYDFTRFTDSGMRWLFRWFDRTESGTIQGPGRALLWSISVVLGGLFRNRIAGSLVGTLFFWVRFFDKAIPDSFAIDAACGLYFLGRKADHPISPKDVIRGFQGVPR